MVRRWPDTNKQCCKRGANLAVATLVGEECRIPEPVFTENYTMNLVRCEQMTVAESAGSHVIGRSQEPESTGPAGCAAHTMNDANERSKRMATHA